MEEKKIIHTRVLNFSRRHPITWKEVKDFKFEDDDILSIGYIEEWENGSDNSGGGDYEVNITRQRLETDEEFKTRVENEEKQKDFLKKRRYESFLKLKKEFEDEKH